MKLLYFVTPEDGALARNMETKLVALPASSGVLFAGVSIVPDEVSGSKFHVWVGCSREFEESTIELLVLSVLNKELSQGLNLNIQVHRGIPREPG